MRAPRIRDGVLAILTLGVAACAARPGTHLAGTALGDRDERRPIAPGHVNDASRLNQKPVEEVWRL